MYRSTLLGVASAISTVAYTISLANDTAKAYKRVRLYWEELSRLELMALLSASRQDRPINIRFPKRKQHKKGSTTMKFIPKKDKTKKPSKFSNRTKFIGGAALVADVAAIGSIIVDLHEDAPDLVTDTASELEEVRDAIEDTVEEISERF